MAKLDLISPDCPVVLKQVGNDGIIGTFTNVQKLVDAIKAASNYYGDEGLHLCAVGIIAYNLNDGLGDDGAHITLTIDQESGIASPIKLNIKKEIEDVIASSSPASNAIFIELDFGDASNFFTANPSPVKVPKFQRNYSWRARTTLRGEGFKVNEIILEGIN